MKILVVGGGGREHALVWKLVQSNKVEQIFCAPGNGGISKLAKCIPISTDSIKELLDFAKTKEIDLTIVGPEAPLVNGIVDLFESNGLKIFGPSQRAAMLEGSKVFAKELMERYAIPTADFKVFEDFEAAKEYLKNASYPIVIKADGLAAGKGVFPVTDINEAVDAIDKIMVKRIFGDAGDKIVIEEFLFGEEASYLVFSDGKDILPLAPAQDHKAIYNDDKGPNTGGMGAYSPAPVVTPDIEERVKKEIMFPVIKAMAKEGIPYKGVLYAGLMITEDGPKVLEFNVRFGDPEAQPILMRLKSELLPLLMATIEGNLSKMQIEWDERAATCVVMAAKGYPGKYKKGELIEGLPEVDKMADIEVFHAGTSIKDGEFYTAGGRVLGVTALGDTMVDSLTKAYHAVTTIYWKDSYYRTDIGFKAFNHISIPEIDKTPRVMVVLGSDSDLKIMEGCMATLRSLGIPYRLVLSSAHRTPARTRKIVLEAETKGYEVIIAAAGMAAHLAGVIASESNIPVIGIPIDSSPLRGIDALLSTVQMPPGIPVATVGIGKAGAKNAAILAAKIISIKYPLVKIRLMAEKAKLRDSVIEKAMEIEDYQI